MATRYFGFNFKPLQVSRSMEVVGSVPARQRYNPADGGYSPDYTLTPLTLMPHVRARDPNGITPSGSANSRLANIRWHVIVNGVKTLIDFTATSDFSLTGAEGTAQAGCLEVRRNAASGLPLTLVFSADLPDTNTSQVHHVEMSFPVRSSADAAELTLELDAAHSVPYNPLRMDADMPVHARLLYGGREVTASDALFVWERLRADGTWEVTGTDPLDYDVTVSATDPSAVTIHRDLIGNELFLRCRAAYEPGTAVSALAVDAASPVAVVSVRRRIPRLHYDSTGVPLNVAPGLTTIYPGVVVRDNLGILENWGDVCDAVWRIGKNLRPATAGGAQPTITLTEVARGASPAIPLSAVPDMSNGAIIDLKLVDRGPLAAAVDSDGAVLTDSDGAILLI